MRLATIRTGARTAAVRITQDGAVETGAQDLGELLRDPSWRTVAERASGPTRVADRSPCAASGERADLASDPGALLSHGGRGESRVGEHPCRRTPLLDE